MRTKDKLSVFLLFVLALRTGYGSSNMIGCSNQTTGINATMSPCNCNPNEVAFQGQCLICNVPNCILCEVGKTHTCDVCESGYEINNTNMAQSCMLINQPNMCGNQNSAIACPCPPDQLQINGSCMACMVSGCILCEVGDPHSCDVCSADYEIVRMGAVYHCMTTNLACGNQNSTQVCPCSLNQVQLQGSCMACMVFGCALCEVGDPNSCDACEMEYEIVRMGAAYRCLMITNSACGNENSTSVCPCNPNQALFNGSCMACMVFGCALCEVGDPHSCDTCEMEYEIVRMGAAYRCMATNSTCGNENSTSVCSCSPNQALFNGSCMACMVFGCALCEVGDPHSCDACEVNYEVVRMGAAYRCLMITNSTCGNENSTSVCPCSPNQVQLNGSCMACMASHCLLCEVGSLHACDICAAGYKLDESNMMHCILSCESNSSTACICDPNLVTFEGQCFPCSVANCILCQYANPNACDVCAHGYALDSNLVLCFIYTPPCDIVGCAECSSENSSVCLNCSQSWNLTENFTCELPSCPGQLIYNGSGCNCAPGYYINFTTYSCNLCHQFCSKCTEIGCILCSTGYYLQQNQTNIADWFASNSNISHYYNQSDFNSSSFGSCLACSANCLSCNDSSYCLECQVGYVLYAVLNDTANSTQNTTTPIQYACQQLSVGSIGVFVDTNHDRPIVIPCVGGCLSCTGTSNCSLCQVGCFPFGPGCRQCSPVCKTCLRTNPNYCLTCYDKNGLVQNKCYPCKDRNCLQCPANVNFCMACDIGFEVRGGVCIPCPENCERCSNGICNSCVVGCSAVNNVCTECLAGCSICNPANIAECNSCSLGFYKTNGKYCEPCPYGCNKCNKNGCVQCQEGFRKKHQSCYPTCVFPCLTCSDNDPFSCITCYAGYDLDSGKCIGNTSCGRNCSYCPKTHVLINSSCVSCGFTDANCASCDPSRACTSCLIGYALSPQGLCVPCGTGCKVCLTLSYCLICADGYFLKAPNFKSSGICLPCSASMGCATCTYRKNQCTTCIAGFSLRGFKCVSNQNCGVNINLNYDYSQFMGEMLSFRLGFLQLLGGWYRGKPQMLTFNSMAPDGKGGVNLNGSFSMPAGTNRPNLFQRMHLLFLKGRKVGNVPLGQDMGLVADNFVANCPIKYCSECNFTNPSICNTCYNGFTLNPATKQCQIPACAGQLVLGKTGNCQCPLAKYPDASNASLCHSCPANCLKCTSATECTSCSNSYYLTSSKSCAECSQGCRVCSSASACQVCLPGFSLNQTLCTRLPYGIGGYYSNANGTLVSCSGGCLSCTSSGSCSTCQKGCYPGSSGCVLCVPPCATCSSADSSVCLTCYSGYVLLDNFCVKCNNSNCVQCVGCPDYCAKCRPGFFADANGQCQACNDACLQCTSASVCTKCVSGCVSISGQCVECLASCSVCNPSNISQCYSCSPGFYMNSSNLCTVCSLGCQICASASQCTSCIKGFRLINGYCYNGCSLPCFQCEKENVTSCTSCLGGYTKSGNSCLVDISCNSTGVCSVCPLGYALKNSGCFLCNVELNCLTCSSADLTVCTSCIVGYTITAEGCKTCGAGCKFCESTAQCDVCLDGYFLVTQISESLGTCGVCSTSNGCATCVNSEVQCMSCLKGYKLIGFKCITHKNIGCRMKLNYSFSGFMAKIRAFRFGFMQNILGGVFIGKPYLMSFIGMREGSVDLDVNITLPEEVDPEDTFNTLTQNLQAGTQITDGVSLSSAPELTSNNFEVGCASTNSCTTTKNVNLGLVLGLGIPLLFIAIVIGVIIKVKSGKKQANEYQGKDLNFESGSRFRNEH